MYNIDLKNALDRIRDKDLSVKDLTIVDVEKILGCFEILGLPETIPELELKKLLLLHGQCFITNKPGALYALSGSCGGAPDPYDEPTLYTAANPALKFSATMEIHKDGVLVKSDAFMQGILPQLLRYNTLLTENEISLWIAEIMTRLSSIIMAEDDNQKTAAENIINDFIDGEIGVITADLDLGGGETMRTLPVVASGSRNDITQLIELEQYLKANKLSDFGIQSNWNAKRESIAAGEADLEEDAIYPYIDHMLYMWQMGFDEVNTLYGTNITVEKAGIWKLNQKALEQTTDNIDEPKEEEKEDGDEDEQKQKSDSDNA